MNINDRIRATREDLDRTQEETALAIECTRRQYIRYEQGQQEMTISKLKKLCEYHKVSADYILGLPRGLDWPR